MNTHAVSRRSFGNWILILLSFVFPINFAMAAPEFAAPGTLGTGALQRVVDVNHDGLPDLIVSNRYPPPDQRLKTTWYSNLGGIPPRFKDSNQIIVFNSGTDIADLSGDGYPDVAAPGEGGIGIYLSDGASTPTLYSPGSDHLVGDNATYGALRACDLNRDGLTDIVSARTKPDGHVAEIVWHQRNADKDFSFTDHVLASFYTDGVTSVRYGIRVADMNNDGYPDILLSGGTNAPDYGTYVLINDGQNTFEEVKVHDGVDDRVVAADVDGDGRLDILSAGLLSLNTGLSPLSYSTEKVGATSSSVVYPMQAIDLDNDGDLDLLYPVGTHMWWRRNRGTTPVTFDDATTLTADQPSGNGFGYPELVDLDQDGDTDIVVSVGGKLLYYENLAPFKADAKVIAPTEGETYLPGQTASVVWRTNVNTAGTAVGLELWRGLSRRVASLGNAWSSDGWGHNTVTIPRVPFGADYRIRAVSLWDPHYAAFSDPITIYGSNAVPTATAQAYR